MAAQLLLLAILGASVLADLVVENTGTGAITVLGHPITGYRDGLLLAMAAALGLGNGAIFGLVGTQVPAAGVGSVTGLVGAAGGLGGFFPPLVLGVVQDATGAYTLGFVFLAIFAIGCLLVNALFVRRHPAEAATEGRVR